MDQLAKILVGTYLCAWDELVEEIYPDNNTHTTAEFNNAMELWITKILNCENSRDAQFKYLFERNRCFKHYDTDCNEHKMRWVEVLQNSGQLSKGSMSELNEEEKQEWYYSSFPNTHHLAFLA